MNLSDLTLKLQDDLIYSVVSVYIYLFENDNVYILGARRGATAPSAPLKYNVPTGHVEIGESPYDAAVRETEEESGIKLDGKFKFRRENFFRGKINVSFIKILEGTRAENKPGPGDGECEQYKWIDITKIDPDEWAFGQGSKVLDYSTLIY